MSASDPLPQGGNCGEPVEPGIVPDSAYWARIWLKLGIALVFAGQGMILGLGLNIADPRPDPSDPVYWILHGGLLLSSVVVMLILGGPLARATLSALRLRRITLDALFSLSLLGALGGSLVCTFTGEGAVYYEVVAIVLVVYTLGQTLGVRTKSRAIAQVRQIRERFDQAWWQPQDGGQAQIRPVRELAAGDRVRIHPGDPVTVDGVVLAGEGFVRETALTGEIAPAHCRPGSTLLAGSYSLDGDFELRVEQVWGNRALDAVLGTVEHAGLAPSALQQQADRIMRFFVPFVALVSLATLIGWMFAGPWPKAVFNSMAVLLVACPCALGLATPIAVWSALWRLSRIGLVARSGAFIDALGRVRCLVFDKTGTLSEERLQVAEYIPLEGQRHPPEVVLAALAAVESGFAHPVARTLADYAATRSRVQVKAGAVTVVSGRGIRASVLAPNGQSFELAVGTPSLFTGPEAVGFPKVSTGDCKTIIHVMADGRPAAVFVLRERLREHLEGAFKALSQSGIRLVILTGDPNPAYARIQGVEVEAGLDPAAKEARVRQLRGTEGVTVFVGDGVNDTAAMAVSDASIAIAGGADLARATSAAVLMGGDLTRLADAVSLCRQTRRAIHGNLWFAASYNIFGMALAAAGMLHPVVAALLMTGSSFFVSMRAIRSTQPVASRPWLERSDNYTSGTTLHGL